MNNKERTIARAATLRQQKTDLKAEKLRQNKRLLRLTRELDYVTKEYKQCSQMEGIGSYLRHRMTKLLYITQHLRDYVEVLNAS